MKKYLSLHFYFVLILFFLAHTNIVSAESLAEKYKNRGNNYYKARKYNQAIREYTNALMEDMDYAEAYYNRGIVFFELQQYYKAIVDFDMAISINPDDKASLYSRGLSYSKVGKLNLAIADIKKSDKLGDNDAHKLLKSGILTRQIEKRQRKNRKIESLIGDAGSDYNRISTITDRNNEFGGSTILTVHSKGDPYYDGKEGIFKTIEYFDEHNKKAKTILLHTAEFNENNDRNKTVTWYNKDSSTKKVEFYYTGKMLNIKGVHYYNNDGVITRKALFDKHGNEIIKR